MSTATDMPATVTHLDGQRAAKKGLTRAQTIMAHCETQLRDHMRAAIPSIMDQVDDSLFDLSNKADTNQLQSTYFEAMRSVRLRRAEMEQSFLVELDTAMSSRMAPGARTLGASSAQEPDPGTFRLVAQDELEETIAVKNIAGKIRNVCHEELFALDCRVALLLGCPNLEGGENPLGPEVLSNAARGAMGAVEANLEIRLLVLKLFDRHLTKAASTFYCEINDWLARQNVLPDVRAGAMVKSQPRTQGQAGQQQAAGPGESAPGESAGSGLGHAPAHGGGYGHYSGSVGGPQHMGAGLSHARHGLPGGTGVSYGVGSVEAQVLPDGPHPMDAGAAGAQGVHWGEQLLGVLDQVMRVGGGEFLEDVHGSPNRGRLMGDLTRLQRAAPGDSVVGANVIRELKASGAVSDASPVDDVMIDVVAMMFDYILQDRAISDDMRALIGRLQIPVLKVAILDKAFFARRSHPARMFINTLAEFGSRASDGEREPTFNKVCVLVERVLDEFELELDVFGSAVEELEDILSAEEDEAERNAWTTSKVAEERERLTDARRRAAQEVDSRLAKQPVPAEVATFLQQHWRHLLAERLFRSGEESDEWRAGIVTMERLLWSVQPKSDAQGRERLLALLPFLLEQLKLGMHEVGLAADTRAPFLRTLSDMHVAILRGDEAQPSRTSERQAPQPEAAPEIEQSSSAAGATDACETSGYTQLLLRDAVVHANDMVWKTASERPQCQGMGATVVAVKLDGDRLLCAHAGDSRLYRLRDGTLEQITRDHTYRQEAIDRGMSSEEAEAEIASNVITRAVGGDATIEVDVNVHDTLAGDLYLACSDGLSDMLDDDAISAVLTTHAEAGDLQSMAQQLIDGANAAGGRDNISVGLLCIDAATSGGDDAALVRTHVATDPGRRRAHNEDAVDADATGGVLVLADGMGGHNAGEVASAMTVKLIMKALCEGAPAGTGTQDMDDFDFQAIEAEFWDAAAGGNDNTALYDAVAEEVDEIVLESQNKLDACFDISGDAQPRTPVVCDAEGDPLLERVLKLTPGTWVEFGEVAGAGTRARLSWVAPGRGRYLFTDRFGQKVSDSTPYGLAVEFRRARLRVLDGIPLFDRVVSKVTRTLRSPRAEQDVA